MNNTITRPFWFETPIILEGVNYGNAVYRGTGATLDDDIDLCFIDFELDTVNYECSNATYTAWLLTIDLSHVIGEHMKWVFRDLANQAA
jgi:hypothetical protein